MRQKLNENPVYQAAAIGILALLVGVMLLTRMGGGAEEAATDPAAPPTGTATTIVGGTTPPTTTDPGAIVDPATGAPVDPTATTPVAGAPSDFKAGPGLPAEVVSAYDGGDAVALLVVNKRGIDDRDLAASMAALSSQPDVTVFATDVKDVAKYSRITEGVDLDRTPALIVIRPKRLSEGGVPTAGVAYGFRGPASVEQALRDALYEGPSDLPYYP